VYSGSVYIYIYNRRAAGPAKPRGLKVMKSPDGIVVVVVVVVRPSVRALFPSFPSWRHNGTPIFLSPFAGHRSFAFVFEVITREATRDRPTTTAKRIYNVTRSRVSQLLYDNRNVTGPVGETKEAYVYVCTYIYIL